MGNRVPGREFRPGHLVKTAGIVSRLTREPVLLVVGVLVEDGNPVVGGPTKKKVLVGIDPRSIFGGLFKGGIEHYVILNGSLEIFFLDGTSRHQCRGKPKV